MDKTHKDPLCLGKIVTGKVNHSTMVTQNLD
jgi:hypothetical protein